MRSFHEKINQCFWYTCNQIQFISKFKTLTNQFRTNFFGWSDLAGLFGMSFSIFIPKSTLFMESWSSGLIKRYVCVLVIEYLIENFVNITVWILLRVLTPFPVGIYMFKVNNKNTRKRCEIWSKLTIKTSERPQWRRSGVFIVNFEHISHLALVFLLSTLSK